MKKSKLIILIISLFFCTHYSLYSESKNIIVSYLYKPSFKTMNVHKLLFPITSEYIKKIIPSYNSSVSSEHQIDHVFISQIFRSRAEQRQELFNYITKRKNFFHFIRLYDKKNEQFAVQLLKISEKAFNNKKASSYLLAHINNDIDKLMKDSYELINHKYISSYLLKIFGLTVPSTYSSSIDSIKTIAQNVLEDFDINKNFLDAAEKTIQKIIENKYHIPKDKALLMAQENISLIIAKNIFEYMRPILNKEGYKIFNNKKIGTQLSVWFNHVAVYSHHSIPELSDEEIDHLKDTLDKGKAFTYAIDLGMKTNKSLNGNAIWNSSNSKNKIFFLKEALHKNSTVQVNQYKLTFIPKQLKTDKSELAVHIELLICKAKKVNNDSQSHNDNQSEENKLANDTTKNNDNKPEENSSIESVKNSPEDTNLESDSSMKKNQDTKSTNGKINQKSFEGNEEYDKTKDEGYRNLNLKYYNKILGEEKLGENKKFEN